MKKVGKRIPMISLVQCVILSCFCFFYTFLRVNNDISSGVSFGESIRATFIHNLHVLHIMAGQCKRCCGGNM